jgi:hypothetical protein
MKIAIYGDSFADEHSPKYPELNQDKSWARYLRDKNFDVTNFSALGSSVYWSYKKYQENHKNFDKNIFIATSPDRLYIPWNHQRQHWNAYTVTHKIHGQNIKNILGFNEVLGYYRTIYNHEEHKLYKELMIKDIMSCENSLVIDNTDILLKISTREIEYYKSLNLNLPWHNDNRFCHMSQEGNNFLYSRIKIWLETGKFNISDWKEECQLPAVDKAYSYFLEKY